VIFRRNKAHTDDETRSAFWTGFFTAAAWIFTILSITLFTLSP